MVWLQTLIVVHLHHQTLSYRTQLQERNLTSLNGRRPVLLPRFAQRIIKRQTKKRRVYEEHCYAHTDSYKNGTVK